MKDNERSLGGMIVHTGSALHRQLERNLEAAGLELAPEEAIILKHLHHHEGLSQQEITGHLCRHKTLTTRKIDALEEKNLVVRVPDKTDRRLNMIFLTNEGKRIFKRVQAVLKATHNEALKGVKPEHLQICEEVLTKIEHNVTES